MSRQQWKSRMVGARLALDKHPEELAAGVLAVVRDGAFQTRGMGTAMTKAVTLNGIKRRGLANWKAREDWARRDVTIWSREHCAWFRPDGKGYTMHLSEAWVVDFPTAYDHTKHCGPEKQIMYYVAREPQ